MMKQLKIIIKIKLDLYKKEAYISALYFTC